jgi:hypothetical protein
MLTFNGGTSALRLPLLELSLMNPRLLGLNIYLMLLGLAVQYVVTRIEWENMRNKLSAWYLGALAVDVATTYAAFGSLLTGLAILALGWLSRLIPGLNLDQATTQTLATGLAILIAAAGAYVPEHELVEG